MPGATRSTQAARRLRRRAKGARPNSSIHAAEDSELPTVRHPQPPPTVDVPPPVLAEEDSPAPPEPVEECVDVPPVPAPPVPIPPVPIPPVPIPPAPPAPLSHTPAMQTPFEQGVPSGFGGLEHIPVLGSQVPTS